MQDHVSLESTLVCYKYFSKDAWERDKGEYINLQSPIFQMLESQIWR